MLKKNEALEILNRGGKIIVNDVYRTARAYARNSDTPETVRYDTAQRIADMDGYKQERIKDVAFSYVIKKVSVRGGAFGVDACADLIHFYRSTLHMDCADIAADLLHAEETQGAFFNRTMWDAFDEIFPDAPSIDIMWLYYGAARDDEEVHGTPEKTKEHAARLIRQHMDMDAQETQWKDAEPAAEPVAEPVAEPAPVFSAQNAETGERIEGTAADRYNAGVNLWDALRNALRGNWDARNAWEPVPTATDPDGTDAAQIIARAIVAEMTRERTAEERRAANKERRETLYAGILQEIRNGGHICRRGDDAPWLYAVEPANCHRYKMPRPIPRATMERIAREPDMVCWTEDGKYVLVGSETRGRYVEYRNAEHCREIADRLDAVAAGRVYKCPDCGEWITFPDSVGDVYRCPDCGAVFDVSDAENVGMWDYFADALDIEYRCDARKEYKSARITVAWGGPNIYIDTYSQKVLLYWWTEQAEYDLTTEATDAVDEWAADCWGCF